ncbi:MAG TPA: hypothetical protein VM736_11265, partial [Gemmatimonadales bacterium]|nr:hypothetical protein [Gemmatimonadales bacterium]
MNVSPVLALAGLVAIGLLATRLPRPAWPEVRGLEVVLAAGAPLVLAGLVLGPGIDFLSARALRALAPLMALALGWIGATIGAGLEWRRVRRIPRDDWLVAGLGAAGAFGAVALVVVLGRRFVPALGAVWTPRVPALLTLAAVGAVSGPGAVTLVARAAGLGPRVVRSVARTAGLETATGTLVAMIPLAVRPPRLPSPSLSGVLTWLVLALGSGVLVAMVWRSVSRVHPTPGEVAWALLVTLCFGAGVGYAADLSPLLVCALTTGLVVNLSPRRHVVRQVLA